MVFSQPTDISRRRKKSHKFIKKLHRPNDYGFCILFSHYFLFYGLKNATISNEDRKSVYFPQLLHVTNAGQWPLAQ